ncbi:hypothetical protein [Sphingomonas xinjiangensis]|uniref:Uncharacterized protein n=1 Tax=Sphingomonas xinjiangensis TaxID=643568 RepID=A0A840YIG6_9SPHN|nr:hypothetical protein [Sphingomonas xinjiangensis]MBB5711869.1 hypothetical protein [Sphingomonas xinjiangensis]
MGLLTKDLQATPALIDLVAAWGRQKYRAALDAVLRNTYAFLKDVDLSSITPAQLTTRFECVGYAASVQTRAVSFFLNAGAAAGWPIGPRLMFGRTLSRKGRSAIVEPLLPRRLGTSRFDESRRLTLTERIIDKFPDFDPAWSARERATWYRHLNEALKVVNASANARR